MNEMKNSEKIIWIAGIIIASGCMHAAISHYYLYNFQQRDLQEQFVEKLILNELLEELDSSDREPVEPELIIEIDASDDAKAIADKQQQAVPFKKSMIVIETQEALQNLLTNNSEPSVIFFHMNRCGWCTKMKPTYDAVAINPEFADLQFYSVNGPELQAQDILHDAIDVKVTGYPLFVFMNHGKFVDKQIGGSSPEVFEHKIKSIFPEIFGVIAPLAQPKVAPVPIIPFNTSVVMIENQETLQNILKSSQEPSVIFFYMNGCGWCDKMRPVFNAATDNSEFANIKFYSVNGPQLNVPVILKETMDQDVTGYPLFIFMHHGQYIDKQVGGANPENFENKIKSVFFNL